MKQIYVLTLLLFFITNTHGSEKALIAFAQDTMANDFRNAQVQEAKKHSQHYPNLSFIVTNAKTKTSLMIRQINQHIANKVDYLIIGATDSKALVSAVEKAYESDIKVILLSRGVATDKYHLYLHSDNYKIGQMAAKYLLKELNYQGTILMLEGLMDTDVSQGRSKGFIDEIKKYPKIKMLSLEGNFLRKDTIMKMQKLINADVHYDAIYSHSDSMLSGVRMVYAKNNLDPSAIPMIGVDYISEAKDAIAQGKQSASIHFPLAGKEVIEHIHKLHVGQKVSKEVVLPTTLITRENYETISPIF